MRSTFPHTCLLGLMLLFCGTSLHAGELSGTYTDAMTGIPLSGVHVQIQGTNLSTTTDTDGRWSFDLPANQYVVEFTAKAGGIIQTSTLVNQHVPQYKPANAHLYSSWYADQGHTVLPGALGLPAGSGQLPAEMPDFLELAPQSYSPLALTVPTPIPRRIRVARRQEPEKSCRNNPIIAIEELDIDEYVKGVLPPEIGVFRSIPGAEEVYKEFAIAAKSYALWFMLYYVGDRKRTSSPMPPSNFDWFHIDDTACNQRYSDERLTITTQASEDVANLIAVKKGAPEILDKIEYAASCGKHGTLPEYGSVDNLVPDNPPENGCAGTWCGHNTCAGHEDNPKVSGSDRCLVRGICQWGSASWGKSGKDYLWMLNHYQPNLQIRDLSTNMPKSVVVSGYAYTDPNDPSNSGVPSVTVTLSDNQTTTTDANGFFTFAQVPLSLTSITATATATGYEQGQTQKTLTEGVTNWASVLLKRTADPVDMGGGSVDMGTALPKDMSTTPSKDMSNTARDMAQPQEMGQSTSGGGTTPELQGGPIGPLVSTSPGIEGGCGGCQSSSSQGPAGMLVMLIGLCGVVMIRRRKRLM